MAHLPVEPEAFGEQVANLFRRHFPDRSLELAGPLDLVIDGRHLALENLYRMVRQAPDRGVEIVEDYIDKVVEGDSLVNVRLPLALARPRIMPRIQPTAIFDHLDREHVAHIEFVNGTVVVFVIDMPQMTVSVTTEQMIRWGLDAEDLDDISRENLARYVPDLTVRVVEAPDGGRAAILSEHDGYDAARLLLDKLHERLAPELQGDFLVATPARDTFVAVSAAPNDFVHRVKERVEVDYRRLPYPITSDLFLVTRDGVAGTFEAA